MLDHVSITVDDLGAAERFYDAVMEVLGYPKVARSDTSLGYGERCSANAPGLNYLSVKQGPRPDDAPARHWCFKAPDRATVEAFWIVGQENGGLDDGPPGLREQYHPDYYAAFLTDPAGNRIEAVCHKPE